MAMSGIAGIAGVDPAAWQGALAAHPAAWFTHDRDWLRDVDGSGGGDRSFAVTGPDGSVAALVPCTVAQADPPVVVSGLTEPAGPLVLADEPAVWDAVDRGLTAVAADHGAAGIALKFPVLGRTGPAPPRATAERHLVRLGYRLEPRSFFCLDLTRAEEQLWEGVSSRVQTQVRKAGRRCVVRPAETTADLEALLGVYEVHAATKDAAPAFGVAEMEAMLAPGSTVRLVALLATCEGAPLGFALLLGLGDAATLFAWGSAPEALRLQLSKLLVWESFLAAKRHGFAVVEYGGSVDLPDYAGLTEFYRRMGGAVLDTVWASKRA